MPCNACVGMTQRVLQREMCVLITHIAFTPEDYLIMSQYEVRSKPPSAPLSHGPFTITDPQYIPNLSPCIVGSGADPQGAGEPPREPAAGGKRAADAVEILDRQPGATRPPAELWRHCTHAEPPHRHPTAKRAVRPHSK